MKLATKTLLAFTASTAIVGSAQAAPIVAQSDFFQDNNTPGGVINVSVGFENAVSASSIFVVGVYLDATAGALEEGDATFGGFSADEFFTDDRVYSYVFYGDAFASNATFDFTNTGGPGVGVALYEVSGADPTTINAVTNSASITTDTADELVIGFAGRNNNSAATVGGSSILTRDEFTTLVRGGGSIAAGSGVASTIPGSQNISWVSGTEGLVAYSFDVVPEPSSLALLGLGGLLIGGRRRRA